jgi:hypothetical protein
MNISSLGRAPFYDAAKNAEEKERTTVSKSRAASKADTFEKTSAEAETGIYKGRTVGGMTIDQLQEAEMARIESFRRMLQSMVAKQGQQFNLSLFGLDLYVTEADRQRAAESIAEGGEYSVDAVATRILDMAKALAGEDSSKIGALRDAVIAGFKAAGVELGGKLPGICEETYQECMKRFDDWQAESATDK